MSMAEIPDMAPIFIKQYHRSSYHKLKVFNSLPTYITVISCNVKEFKHLLKTCLYLNNFCTLEEYFQYKNT